MTLSIEIPREPIEQIAREVFEQMNANRLAQADEEAERMRVTIARIMAKKLITIDELRVLFGECSRGYIGKLLEDADAGKPHPIPFHNLNGLIMFEPGEVLAWSKAPKPLKAKQRKTGGKRRGHLQEVKRAANQ